MPYLNSQKLVPRLAPALDNLHEFTSVEEYDVNSVLPAPKGPLETALVTVEPFIPSLHVDSLSRAFCEPPTGDPDIWFYPYPKGKPFESKEETLIYVEKQRLRANLLTFAVTDRKSGDLAGIMSLGCDPAQATLDVKLMGIKIFPKFRGTHVFIHGCYLLLSYALDPTQEGGLGLVRVGWRTPPENVQSQKAAEKAGFLREGIMRCYEVSPNGSLYPEVLVPDGSGRMTEDAVVYSMTCHDWLAESKRDRLRKLL
ncbi:acyl-CoA N-acyltransferase [Mycena albidolilacea]|uniref:Acyl-CoA N-acyltransferase n=1 Tax=Mycena albidolilacea TaxID=1033008 RepID=A0AAD6ZBM4_9AGAR|nr:acyl-CoA N-acyltransferase [Mycena albidolilacea]